MPLSPEPTADKPTALQCAAIMELLNDPHLSPLNLASAVGASTYRENPGRFFGRLVDNGWVMVVVTKAGEAAVEEAEK